MGFQQVFKMPPCLTKSSPKHLAKDEITVRKEIASQNENVDL